MNSALPLLTRPPPSVVSWIDRSVFSSIPQVLVAHEADVIPFRRDLGLGRETECLVGELAHAIRLLSLVGTEVVQEQLAIEREQQSRAVRREAVVDDALQAGGARALAARLFLGRQLFVLGQQHLRVDQHPRLLRRDVVFPQIELELVGVLAAQEGHALAVRRYLQVLRRLARQRRRFDQAVHRQFFGMQVRHRPHHCNGHCGRGEYVAHRIAPQGRRVLAPWAWSRKRNPTTLGRSAYLPMQKLEKIAPSRSSALNSPVISDRACWARRSSSATSSPARSCTRR